MLSFKNQGILYLILLGFCFICYFDTLNGDFVFDDIVAIVKNKDVTNPATTVKDIFQHDFWGQNLTDPTSHKSYRPLTILMFHYEYKLIQFDKSYVMKLLNFIMHCLNTCLVYKFFTALTSKISISLIGSILFAIHPIHTEAVCGIVGRAELMFCLCYLLALLLFSNINFSKKSNLKLIPIYLMIFILSILGLLFKENAIMILPICIAYDITIRTNLMQHFENRFRVKRVVFLRCGILLALTILLLFCRLYIQDFKSPQFKPMDNPIASNDDFITRILSQNFLYCLNFWILLCPEWLSFDWALGCVELVESFFDIRFATILLLYVLLYYLTMKSSRLVLLSITLIIVPFLPASGILKVGFVIAERILYVPSIGFCLLIAIGFTFLIERFNKFKYILVILLFILIISYILKTRQRANEWTTEDKLFTSGLKVCPNNAKVHYNIARLISDQNKSKAFKHYHEAIRLYPKYEAALMNLGNLYREIGDLITAEKYLKESLELLENYPAAWMNLGIVQAAQKRFDEALESYQKALKYKVRYPTCLYNLGNLYLDMKNYSMAMKYWQETITLNPKMNKAWSNILTLLDNRGLYEDVLRISDKSLQYLPNDATILFIRANVQGKLKNYIEAEQLYLKVIQLNSSNPLYYTNLGVLYHRWDKKDLAEKYYLNALEIDKNFKSAKDNLMKLKKSIK